MTSSGISVIGLGKLGLPLAACLASSGFRVRGIDRDETTTALVDTGKAPFHEAGLAELLAETAGSTLTTSTDATCAVKQTNVTFFLTPTPSGSDGSFLTCQLESAIEAVAVALKGSDKPYHLFVIGSTVMPGTINDRIIPLIEQKSGRKCNHEFGVCYNPEFAAIGEVIDGYFTPDIVVIGESDSSAGEIVEKIQRKLCRNSPTIARISITNSEIAKVALNTYISTKITFANQLADLCEKIPGADVDNVTRAIGADRRISPYYFTGGLPFGGPCFPRDVLAMEAAYRKHGVPEKLFSTIDELNTARVTAMTDRIISLARKISARPQVLLVGLAFKTGTALTTGSPAMDIAASLKTVGIDTGGWDRHVKQADLDRKLCLTMFSSLQSAFEASDLVVLLHHDKSISREVERYSPASKKILLDCWRNIDPAKIHRNFILHRLGIA